MAYELSKQLSFEVHDPHGAPSTVSCVGTLVAISISAAADGIINRDIACITGPSS